MTVLEASRRQKNHTRNMYIQRSRYILYAGVDALLMSRQACEWSCVHLLN